MVDTDPTLLAEVERLRAVRLLLANVEPAKISVREAQLAAAFDVWERQGARDPHHHRPQCDDRFSSRERSWPAE